MLVAREIADIGVPDYVLEELLDEWRGTEVDLAADSRVVEVDGRVVEYTIVRGPVTVAAIAPEFEAVAPNTGSGLAPATKAARACSSERG